MINLSTVQFGTDAEIFLRTITKQPIPVCGMVGGTKDNPLQLEGLGKGFAVQEDNAALEFNIAATHSHDQFYSSIMDATTVIQSKYLPSTVYLDWENASLVFSEAYLRIPEMNVFGCDPDYNAWTMQVNSPPRPPVPGFRSAAAHVHLSWKNIDGSDPTDDDRLELVRLADTFAVLPYIPKENEADQKRRQLYGKAGSFRPKPYGIEHRVLSNSWINGRSRCTQTLRDYTAAMVALNYGIKVDPKDYTSIQEAINFGRIPLALSLNHTYWKKLEAVMDPDFKWKYLHSEFA